MKPRTRLPLALVLLLVAVACAILAGRPLPPPAPTRVPAVEAGGAGRRRTLAVVAGGLACAGAVALLMTGRRKPRKGVDL